MSPHQLQHVKTLAWLAFLLGLGLAFWVLLVGGAYAWAVMR